MSSVTDRFLRYVQIDTKSDDRTGTSPSTAKQHDLAKVLVEELLELGIRDVTYDTEHCYVYASIPASAGCEKAPALGFIAHMDTSPAVTGEKVKPRRVENYDGKNVLLNKEKDIWLTIEDFPELSELTGQDLIAQLRGKELGQRLLIPSNMLRSGERVFLDDVTLDDVERELGVTVIPVEQDLTIEDHILTLSTCTDSRNYEVRWVVQAVLAEELARQ